MDETVVILLNRGAPIFYPKNLEIVRDSNFFQNGFVFCLFKANGEDPILYNEDSDHEDYLPEMISDGLLLVYDGIDEGAIDRTDICRTLRKAISKTAKICICCHANEESMPEWETVFTKRFGNQIADWVPFNNHIADRRSEIIHRFLSRELRLDQLIAELFNSRTNIERSKFINILKLVALEAKPLLDTSGIHKHILSGNYLSVAQKNELNGILTNIQLEPGSDRQWQYLFNYLDKLSELK